MNELDGYDIEDLKVGMSASYAKTISEAGKVVVDGDALAKPTSREPRVR